MVLARQFQYAPATLASGLGFWGDRASGSSMKSAGMAGRRRNLGWYDAYRNRANAISATTSQSNFCFLNSIESRSLVRHRTVVGRTATPGSRGTHFDAVDPQGPRAKRPPRGCNCDANSRTTAPVGSVANPV